MGYATDHPEKLLDQSDQLKTGAYVAMANVKKNPFDGNQITRSQFPDSAVSLGQNELLHFFKKPSLALDLKNGKIEVEGWGISVSMMQSSKLPREIARRFLTLWGQSESQSLNESDYHCWIEITRCVDFDAFIVGRAAPRYVEGEFQRVGANDGKPVVKWFGGKEQKLPEKFSQKFQMVNPGEKFSCFAKFDREGDISSLDRIGFVAEVEIPDEWPLKN